MELCILLSRQERAFCSAGSVNLGLILEKGRCRGEDRAAHGDRQLHVRRFLCGIGGTQNAVRDYGSASCARISRMLQNARVVFVWSRRAVKRLPTSTDRRVGVIRRIYDVESDDLGPSVQDPAAATDTICYVVKKGDTLTSIGQRYTSSVHAIASINRIKNINYLQEGRMLLVPVQSRMSGVKGATFVVICIAVIYFGGKYLLEYMQAWVHQEVLRKEAERQACDALRRPKLKRWQGILDDDRETDQHNVVFSAEGQEQEAQTLRKRLEDEEMKKSYAQLESAYAKFLADSGLSKSGYWRGGLPPASGS
eukprot:c24374_g1_i1 orf=310-1236(-)